MLPIRKSPHLKIHMQMKMKGQGKGKPNGIQNEPGMVILTSDKIDFLK